MVITLAVAVQTFLQLQSGVGRGLDLPSLTWPVAIALLLGLPFAVLFHEFGHYLAGILQKMSCLRFAVGPIELSRNSDKWSVRRAQVRKLGAVAFVPSTFAHFKRQSVVLALAGPMASLLTWFFFTYQWRHAQTASFFWTWSLCADWALAGLLQIMPYRSAAGRSDGWNLWEALCEDTTFDQQVGAMLVPSSNLTPLRLRDWPEDVVCRNAEHPADPESHSYHCYLAYVHFLDAGYFEAAGRYLDRCLALRAPDSPPEYALEAAYFYALHRHDAVTAAKWLALETREKPWLRLRARAAVEMAANCPDAARRLVEEALQMIRAVPPSGAHQYDIDRLQEIGGQVSYPTSMPSVTRFTPSKGSTAGGSSPRKTNQPATADAESAIAAIQNAAG